MLRTLSITIVLLFSYSLQASEYIESFHSDIDVRRNGDLYITETIVVKAEGKSIRRGIYRDFPTHYEDARGRNRVVGFKVLAVTRDGVPEPFKVNNQANGKRVYIGASNRYLSPGFYEYQISYLTTRQIGFFDGFDELYWNVTGTGWAFPIGKASALVSLPEAVTDFKLNGYTGRQGSTQQNLIHRRAANKQAYFATSVSLDRYEGLTIVAGWPKGIIQEPSSSQQRAWFLQDNRPSIIVVSGVMLLLAYYWLIWLRVGKDPKAGVVVPLYQPPRGYSPASMRFIQNMSYDKTCFSTAIINLAVKGAIGINFDDGSYELKKLGTNSEPLAAGEAQVLAGLFPSAQESLSILQSNHSILSTAINKHKRSLKLDYQKLYFVTNRWYLVPGILLTIIVSVVAIRSLPSEEQMFRTLFTGIFTLVPLLMLSAAIRGLRKRGKGGKIQFGINAFVLLIFMGVFLGMEIPLTRIIGNVTWPVIIGIITLILLNSGFHQWLKAPTLAGSKLLDKINGFRHYLEVAEQDEIALRGAPTFTTDIYEAYLPYAIALDLENEWTAKLDQAVSSGTVDRSYTHPHWYHSRGHSGAHFSSNLSNAFSSAIASSSAAPGSSSGSSGGSSGGGGGGGGGGGW